VQDETKKLIEKLKKAQTLVVDFDRVSPEVRLKIYNDVSFDLKFEQALKVAENDYLDLEYSQFNHDGGISLFVGFKTND
jgi:hypothetical protein